MAPPKVAGALMLVPKKPRGQLATSLVVEETQEASSSTKIFLRDYIPPRKPSVKHVNLQKDAKYPLVEPPIPEGIIVEGDILGLIPALKYADHDITDEKKFPKLVPKKFLIKSFSSKTHMIVIELQAWARVLQKARLLNLFDIQHFGRTQMINACVKTLLSCVHGGYMWIDKPMSIDTDSIVRITSLPLQGEDPTSLFFDKKNEKTL